MTMMCMKSYFHVSIHSMAVLFAIRRVYLYNLLYVAAAAIRRVFSAPASQSAISTEATLISTYIAISSDPRPYLGDIDLLCVEVAAEAVHLCSRHQAAAVDNDRAMRTVHVHTVVVNDIRVVEAAVVVLSHGGHSPGKVAHVHVQIAIVPETARAIDGLCLEMSLYRSRGAGRHAAHNDHVLPWRVFYAQTARLYLF